MLLNFKRSILAYVAGLALIIAGVAFTPVAESEWGFDQQTQQYYDINNLPAGTSYNCELSTNVCTEIYEGDPNAGGTYIRDAKVDGTFELVSD